MKIAIVHDWLVTYAGAEKVLEQLLYCYPQADVFTTVDIIQDNQRQFLQNNKITTTFLQKFPEFCKRNYQKLLFLMPLAIEQLDLSAYDLIISSSHAVAKGVLTKSSQVHICYIHTPMRYAWDLHSHYLKNAGLDSGAKGWIAKIILHYMRLWDLRSSFGVDYFVANSEFIAKRVGKTYRREADVIYPPVDVEAFMPEKTVNKEDFYLTASRFVPYKKIDLIIEAFTHMPDKELIVIGDGPDYAKIAARAPSNVTLLGYQPFAVLKDHLQRAKAFIFAAEEDFGILPVEAQAAGTPVVAYGKGGALETIEELGISENPTGVFFTKQESPDIIQAIKVLEQEYDLLSVENCIRNAARFSISRFREELQEYVEKQMAVNE